MKRETLLIEIKDTKKEIVDSAAQLQQVQEEMEELHSVCASLRAELHTALIEKGANNVEVAKCQAEREHILRQIETIREQTNHTQSSIQTITAQVSQEQEP